MSVTNKTLIASKQMEAAQTPQYTAPTTARATIDSFTATNTTASTATISVHLVISGGTAGVTNLLTDSVEIAPNKSYHFPELIGQTIEAAGFISTIGTASAITIRCSGREIT
tara:strand:+ start:361 stop:696 length:336 start_codon:yes stop_codon:yes gene_type:complete